MLPKVCRVDRCQNRLRSDNATGVCVEHRNLWGSCRRCLIRCDWRSRLCAKCNIKEKKSEAEFMLFCWEPGCHKRIRSKSGYCREHWLNGPVCKAPECRVRVVKTCKLGYCRDHDFLASRERYRMRRAKTS